MGAKPGMPEYDGVNEQDRTELATHLAVGRIRGVHGIRGELKVEVLTDFRQRYAPGSNLFIEGEEIEREVLSARAHKTYLLVKLKGLDNRTEAEKLHGLHFLVPRDNAMTLPEGEYYADELVGLRVITTDGVELGKLTEVLWTSANEVYVVIGSFGEVLLPAIAEVVQEVDLQNGEMLVNLLPGLVQSLD